VNNSRASTSTFLFAAFHQLSTDALTMVILAYKKTLQASWSAPEHADDFAIIFGDKKPFQPLIHELSHHDELARLTRHFETVPRAFPVLRVRQSQD
jgi:hypothetical protein